MAPAAERIPPQTASQTDFDLKQHDTLRLEIQTAEAAARANERYAIIALAALWAWTAKEAPNTGFVAAAISALIGILGATRMWALWINMKTKADYVAQLESLLSRPALGGWEHYFRDTTIGTQTIPSRELQLEEKRHWHERPGAIGYTSAAFWLLVIFASPLLGWYVTTLQPKVQIPVVQVRCTSTP